MSGFLRPTHQMPGIFFSQPTAQQRVGEGQRQGEREESEHDPHHHLPPAARRQNRRVSGVVREIRPCRFKRQTGALTL